MKLMANIQRWLHRIASGPSRVLGSREHQRVITVHKAVELGAVSAQLSRLGRTSFRATLRRIRDLYEQATPAIYLQIRTMGEPCRIVLEPWDRPPVSFSGRGWHLVAGAEATGGVDSLLMPKRLQARLFTSKAPDHALFAVAVAHPGQRSLHCHFPPSVTHVTIVADGEVVVDTCRLSHDGARVFRVGRAA